MGFTFYADLLGTSDYYKLSLQTAHDKLDDFYNITFDTLKVYFQNRENVRGILFSDSLFIWGEGSTEEILRKLHLLYIALIQKGLLLRGSLINGALQFEPRHELANLGKMLPIDDTLARAIGLEKTKKGSRLLIDKICAEELFDLHGCPRWKTLDGYVHYSYPNIPSDSVIRRICPSPNQDGYEYLYPWVGGNDFIQLNFDIGLVETQLKEVSAMLDDEISLHYKETLKLFKRSMQRKITTARHFQVLNC